MSKIVSPWRHGSAFGADGASRNVTRFLFVLQVTGLILIVCLRLLGLQSPTLLISFLTLILFVASLLWLYSRYRNIPLVAEKTRLERLYSKFERNLQREEDVIRAAILERERLVVAETEELELTRSTLQRDRIGQKYQALQEKNGAAESRARASKELLTRELTQFKPRLGQLAPFTFTHYLSRSLAPQGLTAGLLAFALIGMQMVSSASATGALLMAALPPAMPTPVQAAFATLATLVASPVPALDTEAPTQAFTATVVDVASQTSLPTETILPASTPQATLPAGLRLSGACIPQNTPRETGLVVAVVDGDTIDVQIGNQVLRVRYIGINTPEQDEALYQEALAYNQSLVLNKTITLVKDTSEVDPFNRLLRYVVAADTFVNQSLVEMGYAEATAYAPDTSCVSAFETAQRQAQTAQLGLWLSTPPAFIPPVTGSEATPATACDPSYPGVCIAPPPPDLDCGDIPFERFQVLQPDPHGFDRDQDGVGCE